MGDAGGDTTVTITGTGLSNAKVYFGVKPGKIVRDNGTTIIAITPIAPPVRALCKSRLRQPAGRRPRHS